MSGPRNRPRLSHKPWYRQLFIVLWLYIRAFFWTKRWFVWAREVFPDPPKTPESTFSKFHGFIIVGLFIIAYGFYRNEQITSLGDLFNSFIANLDWVPLFNIALFIITLYIIYALLLRVRTLKLWRPIGYILLPWAVWIPCFFVIYTTVGFSAENAQTGFDDLVWLLVGISMICSACAIVYTLYRATKTRLNAQTTHPTLGILIELTLSAKALVIALQGKALILSLPYLPSRLLVLALPLIAVIYYLQQAFEVQRTYMSKRHTSFAIELKKLWQGVRDSQRPWRDRLRAVWSFCNTQTFRFAAALLLLFLALIFVPSGLTDAQFLRRH